MAQVNIELPCEPYRGDAPFVFISYAHDDAALVYPEIKRLAERGYRVWYDQGISPCNEWPEEIAQTIGKAVLFIVFISTTAINSHNVRREINYALKIEKLFLAIHLSDTVLSQGLDLQMSLIQAIHKWRLSDEIYLRKLLEAIPDETKGIAVIDNISGITTESIITKHIGPSQDETEPTVDEMSNDQARLLYEQSMDLYDKKDYSCALDLLDKLDRYRPNSRRITTYRALCLVGLGRLDEGKYCRRQLEGRVSQHVLAIIDDMLIECARNGMTRIEDQKDVANIFLVQSVSPVSDTELSVFGIVKKGAIYSGNCATIGNLKGDCYALTIHRVGTQDLPLIMAREGQRVSLLIGFAVANSSKVEVGDTIICDSDSDAHAITEVQSEYAVQHFSRNTELSQEQPRELLSVKRLFQEGKYYEAECLLKKYPFNIHALVMLAQAYLESNSPLHNSKEARIIISSVFQQGGDGDPKVIFTLAHAMAEDGDPELGVRFLERLYISTLDLEVKRAIAQRINEYRIKYNLDTAWEFADRFGEVILETKDTAAAIRAVAKELVPLDSFCRKNHVGNFEPIKDLMSPLFPEIANMYPKNKRKKIPSLFAIIIIALFLLFLAFGATIFLAVLLTLTT